MKLTEEERAELEKIKRKAFLEEKKKLAIKKAKEEARKEPTTLTGVAKQIWKKIK